MSISEQAILIITIVVLFYFIYEIVIENFITFDEAEGFCSGPNCEGHKHHNRGYYNSDYNRDYYYNRYYDNYYNRYYDPYNQYWYNPWGYLPCMNSIFGGTYCW
jgi:hypothetical protein